MPITQGCKICVGTTWQLASAVELAFLLLHVLVVQSSFMDYFVCDYLIFRSQSSSPPGEYLHMRLHITPASP